MIMEKDRNDDDNEWVNYDAKPQEVRSDGTVKLPSGMILDLADSEYISPNNETCYPVFVITDIRNTAKKCPVCFNTFSSSEKPLFFMDNGEFCYPCISCEKWIWFIEEEPWMYWME